MAAAGPGGKVSQGHLHQHAKESGCAVSDLNNKNKETTQESQPVQTKGEITGPRKQVHSSLQPPKQETDETLPGTAKWTKRRHQREGIRGDDRWLHILSFDSATSVITEC